MIYIDQWYYSRKIAYKITELSNQSVSSVRDKKIKNSIKLCYLVLLNGRFKGSSVERVPVLMEETLLLTLILIGCKTMFDM